MAGVGKFYITTAIDYPNGVPHMGHAYEKVVTDCYARWHRLRGDEVWYLTGTDENGQKLAEAAKEAGEEPQAFVDRHAEVFRDLCQRLNVSNDDFIRTTEERHRRVCRGLWDALHKGGHLYFGKYSGLYCLACENFYTEVQAPDRLCPHHRTELALKEEDGHFFKMSSFADWIAEHIRENPRFIVPERARKETLARLTGEPVRDVAFSRPNNGWGIPVPQDERFVMYTWADALMNYYSAPISAGAEHWWPAQTHVIGKDIVWFHCVIWPCMLKALDLPLPEQVYVHGMVLGEDGKKMSKSLGNVVDPLALLEKYPVDSFRYYILRCIPARDDGVFSERELVERHNKELGNDFGNLIMRVIKLSLKSLPPGLSSEGVRQEWEAGSLFEDMNRHMAAREHDRALDVLWRGVNDANQYVNRREPWKLKEDARALAGVVYNCCFAIHTLARLLAPFLPATSAATLGWLGVGDDAPKFGATSYHLTQPSALFPRIDP